MAKMLRTALVITTRGIADACQLHIGDMILCADGAFRKVEIITKSFGKVCEVKGHGHPNLVVPVNQRLLSTSYYRKDGDRHFNPFSFLPPAEMKGHFWCSPSRYPFVPTNLTETELWLAGLVMATGSLSYEKVVDVSVHEAQRAILADELKKMKLSFNEECRHPRYLYVIEAPFLAEWTGRNLRGGQGRRTIPVELLGASFRKRKAFFDGYAFGKVAQDGENYRFSANNKKEALSVKILSQTLSYSTALYYKETKSEEGVKEYWQIVAEKSARSSVEIGRNRCGLVREVRMGETSTPLLEIEVSGGAALVVDGLIFE